ncbi:TrbC/VirB2 family protein [Rubrobacter aplysinae]|uniref:TrbC/VirB2 family protein n=1 Tax=Rubrobacter aplysinae TaxID=909625 RepID=UPI000A029C05|nr:TrbC/VirB2 family protein [Rubrobacter aplysinae]
MRDKLEHAASPPADRPDLADNTESADGALPGSTGIVPRLAATIGARGTSLTGAVGERMFIISVALYTSVVLMLMSADNALAQGSGGGGGGAVEGALQSAVDWLSNIIVVVGTLGLLVASVFWIFSGSNERRREKATGWVASCGIAIAVAFLAPSLVTLIQDWTGGGG